MIHTGTGNVQAWFCNLALVSITFVAMVMSVSAEDQALGIISRVEGDACVQLVETCELATPGYHLKGSERLCVTNGSLAVYYLPSRKRIEFGPGIHNQPDLQSISQPRSESDVQNRLKQLLAVKPGQTASAMRRSTSSQSCRSDHFPSAPDWLMNCVMTYRESASSTTAESSNRESVLLPDLPQFSGYTNWPADTLAQGFDGVSLFLASSRNCSRIPDGAVPEPEEFRHHEPVYLLTSKSDKLFIYGLQKPTEPCLAAWRSESALIRDSLSGGHESLISRVLADVALAYGLRAEAVRYLKPVTE
jgi:hypothetical protein